MKKTNKKKSQSLLNQSNHQQELLQSGSDQK
jgi:hypothetical protein